MGLYYPNSSDKSNSVASDDEQNIRNDIDVCSRTVVNIRSRIYYLCKQYKRGLTYLFYIGLHTLLIAFLVAAIIVHNKGAANIEYWKGLGLLIVIYSLLYIGLFYYVILKPYFGAAFDDAVRKPTESIGRRFWKIGWGVSLAPIVVLVVYVALRSGESPKTLISFLGIIVFILFGFIFSKSPGHIRWRPVYSGFILQFLFGLITIKWDTGRTVLRYVGERVSVFLNFTHNGTVFVYGPLVGDSFVHNFGSTFAFSVLPVIFFFAFFVNILSYYNILQWFILKLAWLMQSVMGTTVCESVNAAASIFLGQTESILLFKDQIVYLTRSELHAIMCEGWATVAGTVLAAYISFGISPSHLIAASVMSAPAALSYSKLFYPEREMSKTTFKNIVLAREEAINVLEAACRGAITAIALVASIIANIIAFLSFMAFLDSLLRWFGILLDFPELSFEYILTKLFIPISFLMGVDDNSIDDVALLVGTKTFVNEFRAYEIMGTMKHKFSARTEAIATYALCGFSNFSSIGIMIGGISALEPSKASHATEVAMRAFVSANIVCFITACVAGILMDV